MGLHERRNVVGVPLPLLQPSLDLRGLDDLLDEVHLLLSVPHLGLATERDMISMW